MLPLAAPMRIGGFANCAGAIGEDLLFEIGAVLPAGPLLGFIHGDHQSGLVDTIVTAEAPDFKGGMTGPVRPRVVATPKPHLAKAAQVFYFCGLRKFWETDREPPRSKLPLDATSVSMSPTQQVTWPRQSVISMKKTALKGRLF
jgi:hypothetical protein